MPEWRVQGGWSQALFSDTECQEKRYKLKRVKFHLNSRKCFYTVRTVRSWYRLFRGAMMSLDVEIFKISLSTGDLGNMLQLILCKQVGLDYKS